MVHLTAVIITFNEERNIERCIESLRGVADSVVVLDSGSTDHTEAICREHGAAFHTHPFDNFINQKNRATSLAASGYILSLDADEALSESLRQSILRVKASWTSPAYKVKRLTNYCGRWIRYSGWYPDVKVRLFQKDAGEWRGNKVHEYFHLHTQDKPVLLDGDLLHYSFYTVQQHMDTVNKFSTLKAEALYEKGRKGSIAGMLLAPASKFIRQYIWHRGFLDGFYGLVIACNSAHGVFLKHAKLRAMHRRAADSASS